ncbi:MAG: AAA family ATPase [Deltaproteobacteria bacterium]|nr:AAA family ATPase [Deltaproteobacteria bacterium]
MLPPGGEFVGRARELYELGDLLTPPPRRRNGAALLAGEPGIGKTRLAEEVAARAAAAGFRVLWGRAWESGGAPAYWPWIQVLRGLARSVPPATWRAWVGDAAATLAPLTPDVAPPPGEPRDGEASRFALFGAAAELLRRAAAERPLLIVLDDLHAADVPSLALAEFAVLEWRDAPIAWLGTYRDSDAAAQPALATSLARLARQVLRLPLAGLSEAEVGELIAGVAPAGLGAGLHAASGGNPLFVVELMRGLGVPALGSAAPVDDAPLPSGVRAVAQARLAQLSDAARRTLEMAAVMGVEIDLAWLGAALALAPALVLDTLNSGIAAGIVAGAAAPLGRPRFRHALLREALLDTLPGPRRATLHALAAAALERVYAADLEAHVATLAHHYRAAGISQPAFHYSLAAARRAVASCADEEAIDDYRHALRLLADQPAVEAGLEATLRIELGRSLTRVGDAAAARDHFLAAAALARERGDGPQLAHVVLGLAARGLGVPVREADADVLRLGAEALALLPADDDALRARLMARLAAEQAVAGDSLGPTALGDAAIAMARRLGDPIALAHTLSARHFVLWRYEHAADRLAIAAEIVALGTRTGDRDLTAQGRLWRMFDLMCAGDAAAIDAEIDAFAALASGLRHPRYHFLVHQARSMRAIWQGRFDVAERETLAAFALVERVGDAAAQTNPSVQLFAIRRAQGRLAEQAPLARLAAARFPDSPVPLTFLALIALAEGDASEARDAFERVARHDFEDLRRERRVGVLPFLAELCATLGDARRAAPLAALLAPHTDTVVPYSATLALGVGAHYLALLAATRGARAEAIGLATRAVEHHAAMDAPPWLTESRVLLAQLLLADEPMRARELASAAQTTAPVLGMHPAAAAAAEVIAAAPLLRVLPSPPPRASGPRRGVFRPAGRTWLIGDDERAPLRLKGCKGFRHIAALLRRPGAGLTAVALAGGGGDTADATTADTQRLEDLREALAEAERFNDRERATRAHAALQELAAPLARAAGLGGRRRPGSTAAERARINVSRTIGDAIRAIAAADPRLGRYFSATIRTGALCSFTPDPRQPIDWDV